jgi:hypothetical protein
VQNFDKLVPLERIDGQTRDDRMLNLLKTSTPRLIERHRVCQVLLGPLVMRSSARP